MLQYDPVTDSSGKELYRICSNIPLPEFFKQASLEEIRDFSDESVCFADVGRRHFPIGSPQQTYVSQAFLMDKQQSLQKLRGQNYVDRVQKSIEKAAEVWGIQEEMNELKKSLQKTAATVEYMAEGEYNGRAYKFYPVKTAEDVKQAQEQFEKDKNNIPMELRSKIASNIQEQASRFDVEEIPEITAKYAGLYFPDREGTQKELSRRQAKIKEQEHIQAYDSLKKIAENVESVEDVMKIAEFCYQIEQKEGLYADKWTSRELGDPVEHFFTQSVEKVAQQLDTVEMGGKQYSIDDLQGVSKDVYKQAFDMELDPSNKQELRDILPTVPLSDVPLFEELSGIQQIQ